MRGVWRIGRLAMGAAAVMISASGCATVISSDGAAARREAAVERAALVEAAAAVAQTRWPKPERASLAEILSVGVVSSDRMTENKAAEIYLSALRDAQARQRQVFADALAHLEAARLLASATRAAAESVRPTASDISVVEEAIGELRGARDIYIAALKALSKEGEMVEPEAVHALKAEFNAAIAEIGAAADRLAEAVAEDRTSTYAGRNPRSDGVGGSF
jgi:uncharacterized protein YceK